MWESVTKATIQLANSDTQYTITVWCRENDAPPNDVQYSKRKILDQVLMSYNGLDGIKPKQIFDDVTSFFADLTAIEIVNKDGDGFHYSV